MSAHAISIGLKTYAGKRWPTANATFRKHRLADILNFTERRVRSFWEANAAAPRDEEVDAIEALIGPINKEEQEDAALSTRIAELEAQVAFLVAALARDEMEAAGASLRRQGGMAVERRYGAPDRRSQDRA